MLFKISHIQDNGTMAAVEGVEALNKYEAYVAYLDKHTGVHPLNVVQADDTEAVKAITQAVMARAKEDKKMDKSAVNTVKADKKNNKKSAPKKSEPVKKTAVKADKKQQETVGVKATFTLNDEHNGIEIKFTEKPSAEVRAEMKALKFRWHQTKGLWYAKQSAETIALAEKICGVKAEVKKSKKQAQPKAEEVKTEVVKAEEPKAKKPSRKGIESYKAKEGERITDRLVKALNRTEGITAEIVSTKEDEDGWLWVTGEGTKEHKDTLKKLGFFWSGKKQAWYMSPAPLKRNYKTQFGSMDALRGAAIA